MTVDICQWLADKPELRAWIERDAQPTSKASCVLEVGGPQVVIGLFPDMEQGELLTLPAAVYGELLAFGLELGEYGIMIMDAIHRQRAACV